MRTGEKINIKQRLYVVHKSFVAKQRRGKLKNNLKHVKNETGKDCTLHY